MREHAVELTPKDIQALDVATLYYEVGLTQAEIGEKVHLSRPTVSKLLGYAQRRGFVLIEVLDPREHDEVVIARLRERFDLAEVRLVSAPRHLPGQMRASLGAQGADLLASLVRDGDTIAVEGSVMMADIVRNLAAEPRRGVRVWQMARCLSACLAGREETSSPRLLAAELHATLTALDCPLVAASVPEANRMRARSATRELLDGLARARIAIFTVTPAVGLLPFLGRLDLSDQEAQFLQEHAVGEICGRIVDIDGLVCLPDLNNRTLGISLTDLRHIEQKVLVAGGAGSAPIVRAALVSRYVDRLVVDVDTAREVLRLTDGD